MNNSATPVLRHEDQSAFDRLLESYISEFKPATTHEQFLVDQLANSRWRLDRARILEALALDQIATPANLTKQTQIPASSPTSAPTPSPP